MTDQQRLELLRAAKAELKLTTQGYVQWVEGGKVGGHWARAMLALNKLEADLKPDPRSAARPGGDRWPEASELALDSPHVGNPPLPRSRRRLDRGAGRARRRGHDGDARELGRRRGRLLHQGSQWDRILVRASRQCPAVGTRLRMGAKVGDIAVHPNGAHVHFGMDARVLQRREGSQCTGTAQRFPRSESSWSEQSLSFRTSG